MEFPKEVLELTEKLKKSGYQVFLVGGCVRNFLLEKKSKDWDITTNANPEEIQKIFADFGGASADKPATVYENTFGTVGVKTESEDPTLKIIEVTTFRLEGKYTDKRHPDEIKFAKTIEEDLSRRDFTVNALALEMPAEKFPKIIDPYGGQKDLKNKIIRTVGEPEERFSEDALRLMRAVRFATELNFTIEDKTAAAIKKESKLLAVIAKERIRDELEKIIMSERAAEGIKKLAELGLLSHIIPELTEGIGVGQNKHHIYEVFDHGVRALDYAAKNNCSLIIRLATLLHDVGKPRTKRGEGEDSTFYNHEIVGAKMTFQILSRLHFPKEIIEKTTHLVRYHLFYYNVGEVTEAGVRRFLHRVKPENIDDLIKVREADRIGSGVPKAVPYKLRHLLFMVEKVKQDPLSPKMLAVDGKDVMEIAKIEPGPKVGQILSILLDEILEDPKKNEKKYLENRIEELIKLKDQELKKMSEGAKEKKEEFEGGLESEMKKKYYV
ncbi:MAG: HDIG domain-containing protein [bacterium]|nr:HDIG domain-containing protein [bacterium]